MALCKGGPVESARGFVLHTADWTGDGSLVVDEAVALTASLDVLKAIADGGGPREGLLALGYAGWGPGQLDEEMQRNAWLSAPANVALVFDADHATKWRRALAGAEGRPACAIPRRRPRLRARSIMLLGRSSGAPLLRSDAHGQEAAPLRCSQRRAPADSP